VHKTTYGSTSAFGLTKLAGIGALFFETVGLGTAFMLSS